MKFGSRIATIVATALALAVLPMGGASAAGKCWVEANTPYRTTSKIGSGGIYATGSNHCYPPSTVNSIRVELQKRSGFWPFYSWKRVAGGATTYAERGDFDMYSDAFLGDWACSTGHYRTFTYGTANAQHWFGATASSARKIYC